MKKIIITIALFISTIGIAQHTQAVVGGPYFTDVSTNQVTIKFDTQYDATYASLVSRQQPIMIQYRPWGCGDNPGDDICPAIYIQPNQQTFAYQFTNGVPSLAPMVLTNLNPGQKYRVTLGYQNQIQCFTTPCNPITYWEPNIYSFTTNTGYGTTQLMFSNITNSSAQVSLTNSSSDVYAEQIRMMRPIYIKYRARTCSDAPINPVVNCSQYVPPEVQQTFTYGLSGLPLPITLHNLTPGQQYIVWLGYDNQRIMCNASMNGIGGCIPSGPTYIEWNNNQQWTFTTNRSVIENNFLTQKLVIGVHSNEVAILQNFLISRGYLAGIPDGAFGRITYAAVKRFQADYGLGIDGRVGPGTRAVINAMLAIR